MMAGLDGLPRMTATIMLLIYLATLMLNSVLCTVTGVELEPWFNESTPTNVTFHIGEMATLKCDIENLGTKTVTWRKTSLKHPLTIGAFTFVTDPRISIHHNQRTNEWNLIIHTVESQDAGQYECQISAVNKKTRHIQLNVNNTPLVSKEEIKISGTEYVEQNKPIRLTCKAKGSSYPPQDIDWFKDGEKISADATSKIFITKRQSLLHKTITSELSIDKSRPKDAGNYVCRSSDKSATNLQVHVLIAGTSNVKRGTQAHAVLKGSSNKDYCKANILWTASILAYILWTN